MDPRVRYLFNRKMVFHIIFISRNVLRNKKFYLSSFYTISLENKVH